MPANTAKEILRERYQNLFDFANEVVEKGPGFLVGRSANTLTKGVTLFHYARALYLLDAIKILCSEGYATEAMVILRSLLNLYVNIRWLTADDIDSRMERFADFEVIYKKRAIDAVKRYGSLNHRMDKDNSAIHDEDFQRIKRKYGLHRSRDFHNWSGMSISEMAKEVSLERDYHIIYAKLSEIEHTGPASARDYVDDSDPGKMIIKSGSRDKDIALVLLTALDFFLGVKGVTHRVFDIQPTQLEIQINKLNELKHKCWNGTLRQSEV